MDDLFMSGMNMKVELNSDLFLYIGDKFFRINQSK